MRRWGLLYHEHRLKMEMEKNGGYMETREYTTINRTALGWPDGPWNGEPDKVQWQDQQTGMPCLAVRHPESGHWCGYVGVDPDHPHFEQSYDDVSMADGEKHGNE